MRETRLERMTALRRDIAAKQQELAALEQTAFCPWGQWEIETEADANGWGRSSLGKYEGHVFMLAMELGKQATHQLFFRRLAGGPEERDAGEVEICIEETDRTAVTDAAALAKAAGTGWLVKQGRYSRSVRVEKRSGSDREEKEAGK